MSTPFDYINSISAHQDNQILSGELSPDDYNSFIVNLGLSLHKDTILLANEMNKNPGIPADCQYHYLHTLVSKRKRYAKWPKKHLDKSNEELFKVLKDHYKFSHAKCVEVAMLLSKEQKMEVVAEFTSPKNKK